MTDVGRPHPGVTDQGVTDQGTLSITALSTLSGAEVASVDTFVAQAGRSDGFLALNEAALLHLRHDRPNVRHVLATIGGRLVGYAQLNEEAEPGQERPTSSVGQLVVRPGSRCVGVGSALLTELLAITQGPLQIWALGNTEAARRLAVGHGLVVARELLIMTRSLADAVPMAALPPDTSVRTFVVGQDEEAWLRLNARAFACHPEQGSLTRTDLDERMAEPWFDAQGFLLAEQAAGLVGFHWTKQHPDLLGEVYVLGVDPEAGGRGLGKALLVRGLEHLRSRKNRTVELYVEADHVGAVGLYLAYGFTVSSRDVMYAQPGSG